MNWEDIARDLNELYQERAQQRGRLYARWRYALDLLSVMIHRAPAAIPDTASPPRLRVMFDAVGDAAHAVRVFRARPAATLVAVLGLAVAIGVGTSVFAVLNAVALRPIGVPNPEAVARVFQTHDRGSSTGWPYSDALALRERSSTVPVEILYDLNRVEFATVAGAEQPARINSRLVGGSYFDLLQGSVAFGRLLQPADDVPGAPPVAVVSYQFWERRLESDRSIVGRSIWLNGEPLTVVGVTARTFSDAVDRRPALWAPLAAWSTIMRGSPPLDRASAIHVTVVARRPADMTEAQAQSLVGAVATGVAADRYGTSAPPGSSARLDRLDSRSMGAPDKVVMRTVIALVLFAIGLILLLACANVANLLVASALSRSREIGVRLALGATRGRLIRQLLTESALLGVVAGLLGLVCAAWGLPLLLAMIRAPGDLDVTFDYRVFMFLTLVSVATGVGAGLAPARHGTRGDLLSPLKGEPSASNGRASRRTRRGVLVGIQSAASVLLLVLAALITRGAATAARVDVGFAVDTLTTTAPELGNHGYDADSAVAFWDRTLPRVQELSNVSSAALVTYPPFGGSSVISSMERQGRRYTVYHLEVSADYFSTLGLKVVRGRGFTTDEVRRQAPVVVISEAVARDLSPGEDPLGQPFDKLGARSSPPTVIGIVANAVIQRIGDTDGAAVYSPIPPKSLPIASLITRARRDPESILEPLRTVLRSSDATLRPTMTVMSDSVARQLDEPRALASLAGSLGAMALLLALVGIYGVASFMVGQRTTEIGVRMAIGATLGNVLALLLRDTLRPVAIGMTAGVVSAVLVGRILSGALFGVSAYDPVALAGAVTLLTSTAVVAAIVPALRAARLNPSRVLRS